MGGDGELRATIRQACRADEAACVAGLLAAYEEARGDRQAVDALARSLVALVRRQRQGASGVDHLMHEFSLSSHEGIALMCLAEALLRIPDRATADRLIRDKIGHGDWQSHLGGNRSLFVNAAAWGLLLTGKLVAIHSHNALGQALGRLLARSGEPIVRRGVDFALRLLGQQFVMGESIEAALVRARDNEARGYRHSFDMLGEAAMTAGDAERYGEAYTHAIHAIGAAAGGRGAKAGPGISVKLSALHPRYCRSQRQRVMAELAPRLRHLAHLAKGYDIGLNIDAEEADRLDLSLDLFAALAEDPQLDGWDGLGFVVQAYQKRCPFVIDWLVALARRQGRRFMLRLVKGAYWDSEIKRAQVDGMADYPVFTRKSHSDLSYLVCAGKLLASGAAIYPQFATHNAHTLAAVRQMALQRGVVDYEFQCLHGMGEALYDNVVGADGLGIPCRIYAPVGSHETLLPYLVRRLLENGANSSFVHRLVDSAVSADSLVEDPGERVRREGGKRNGAIPLPRDLYGPGRRNSAGLDLADEATIAGLEGALASLASRHWRAHPDMAGGEPAAGEVALVRNPARNSDAVGEVTESPPQAVATALAKAAAFAPNWHETPVAERAACLLRAADLMEEQRPQLASLCIREAGKTWGNAVAEVREAVDFCRYYARQLLDGAIAGTPEPPGPVACISPWNFPLAIFVGQVSAALAAGSPVLAKPAEQTPLVAALAVRLLHRAGVPLAALQLLPGRGEVVGAALTADSRVRGVVFTGSTQVARAIERSIADREGVRLTAETGGQNAMIVDSSALPEQVVQDVLVSGFDSAGQRCSALRLLCLQKDIADRVLAMLKAAMAELTVGDPADLATDIGPVIDSAAKCALLEHIEAMRRRGKDVFQVSLPPACGAGHFVAPTLIEIDEPAELQGEVFGPVVHVLRFAGDRLTDLLASINASGYGLTMGLHSRIEETLQLVIANARVGNLYVNRNMVGAVVGVQPFGGEGLSGTGPKAGGPLYLPRLAGCGTVTPRNLGCNTVARTVDPVSPFRRLAEWAFATERHGLARLCAEYAELTPADCCIEFPGPTGEANSLRFVSRGRLLCLGESGEELLWQVAACLATGNQVALADSSVARDLLREVPAELAVELPLRPADDLSGIAGILPAAGGARALRLRLAAGEGPLMPVIEADSAGRHALYRLVLERVLCVNTAASGGNPALMALQE